MVNITCVICSAAFSKYKCGKCHVKYCSVACYNVHNAGECKVPKRYEEVKEPFVSQRKYFFQTEDTVPPDTLSLLAGSRDLVEVLKDSELRNLITAIDSAPDPSRAIQEAMQNRIFVKFVDECLRVVES